MKLWYQSMSREAAWGKYQTVLREHLERVKDPDTQLEVHGITKVGGVGDQFLYLDYLETGEVLENVHRAVEEGFDAFLIGNIGDPGLQIAREIADIPVLGLGETSFHTACMMGANFSLVTINEKFTPRIIENVYRYRMERQLRTTHRMSLDRIADLGDAFGDEAARKVTIDQFLAAANANVEDGAEVVIAAGGVVMVLLSWAGVFTAARETPILDGTIALVKMGEAAVKLNRAMGGKFTSKRLVYAPPPADQIAELRSYYGAHIYPTVKEP